MKNAQAAFAAWQREVAPRDAEMASQLEEMAGDPEAIARFFGAPLAFGTAGLRGILAPGPGAMNRYTVAAATRGLAAYLLEDPGAAARGVVIGRDSRRHSEDFARLAAAVLSSMGVRVYLFDDLRPTPMVSFAVRDLSAAAGINITASHNPKEYNGYKVYGADGAQISPQVAEAVSERIARVPLLRAIDEVNVERELSSGCVTLLGEEVDERYLSRVLAERVDTALLPRVARDLRVVYTPFHGAGRKLVPEALRRAGVTQLFLVGEQMSADGDFPTLQSPNPENPEGFALGIALAEKVGSDLVIATDPDADRVGVAARARSGEFRTITGNRMGALLLDYILRAHTANGDMPPRPYAVKTIVTSELAAAVCRKYGVPLVNVLTGFKYIGGVIEEREGSFLLGFEESYGYLKGTYARDKDAVVASMLICEMAGYYKERGMTLLDAQEALLSEYGYYDERTENFLFEGAEGDARRAALLARLRGNPPRSIAGLRVLALRDYLAGKTTRADGETEGIDLPRSDVLYFELEGGSSVVLRPSGTEPKVKLYLMAREDSAPATAALLDAMQKDAKGLVGV